MRDVARHLLRFGADESCGKCFPCRIGLRRAYDEFAADAPVDQRRLEAAARGARARQPLRPRRRHAGAAAQPARPLPRRAGARHDARHGHRRRDRGRGRRRARRSSTPPKAADRWVPTSASTSARPRSAPAASAWSASRARPSRCPPARRSAATGWRSSTEEPTARRVARAVVELVLSELPEAPGPTTELAQVADAARGRRAALAAARRTRSTTTSATPTWRSSHELCISCGRCVRACDEVQGAFALTATGRGFEANIIAGLDAGFEDSTCVACGACADTCPTDAITEISLVRRSERERS